MTWEACRVKCATTTAAYAGHKRLPTTRMCSDIVGGKLYVVLREALYRVGQSGPEMDHDFLFVTNTNLHPILKHC